MLNIYKFLFIILFLPQFLLSQDIPTTPIKLLAKESQQQAIAKPTEQTNTDDLTQNIEDQIDSENKLVDDVINNINNESYLTTLPEKNYYDNEILFLTNRINANNLQKNTLAVKRDELRVEFLKEKATYEDTLKNIILGKQEFRNKNILKKF